jgi:hypothetical protein
VTGDTGKPVEGASVSFRLAESGPTGVFSSGARSEIVTTQADGRAAVWGMQWNRTTGPFELRITAVKGQARAGTVCPLFLTDIAAAPRTVSSGGHKWLWIALAVAGAAGGTLAAGAIAAKTSAGAAAPAGISGPRIGTPTVAIGRP